MKINGDTVYETGLKCSGVIIILVEPFSCSEQESRYFNIHQSSVAATELSTYLRQVRKGVIIVGVRAADEPARYLTSAFPTLQQLGVDVSDVRKRGSFVFVAKKGFPAKTQLRKTPNKQEGARYQARLTVDITGIIENSLSV